jgi:TatD DNase family protein
MTETETQRYRIIDSHCHAQFPQYDQDRDEVIRRALDAGIGMICVGTDERSNREAVALARQYEGVWASIGIHPTESGALLDELAKDTKVVAIGEIGLDYYRTIEPSARAQQRERFFEQLELAQSIKKPTIIHCRDAHDDMLRVLRERPEVQQMSGVIHSFNGTPQQAQQYLELDHYIGLNAIVTFSKAYQEMIRILPLDRILLETDAPYLAPAPYRGKRNEPLYIEVVGKYIAEIRGISAEELFQQTTKNAGSLFNITV